MASETQNWHELSVTTSPEFAEAIEFAMNELDALGTEIDGLRKKPDDPVDIKAYFGDLPNNEAVTEALRYAFSVYGHDESQIPNTKINDVEQTDWLAEWKKHWRPTVIGKFIIAPPWDVPADDEKLIITIEPNMAFGTGTHETTKLCIAALGNDNESYKNCLDVGTGTGILAIAVAKLHQKAGIEPELIFACDTDADSVKIAAENAISNNVGRFITFADGSIDETTPKFELVLANLTIDVILPLLDLLLAKSEKKLIMSGILKEQQPMIESALNERAINDFVITNDGEWIAVEVSR